MFLLSGGSRDGGTVGSITPWWLQKINRHATTRLQPAITLPSVFPGVVAKQRWSISPLHSPALMKYAVHPFPIRYHLHSPFFNVSYHHMKESNCSTIAILQSKRLFVLLCHNMAASTTTCCHNNLCGQQAHICWRMSFSYRRWSYWQHNNQLWCDEDSTATTPSSSCATTQAFLAKTKAIH